jgi:small-conductance mechanosensitive channel
MKELNKLQEQRRKIHEQNRKLQGDYIDIREDLINDQIQKLNYLNQGNCWKDKIQSRYKVINNNNNNKDIVILGLELIKFNLEHKKKLKEIFEEYYSEDFIKDLLSKLYEKYIEIIEYQIK